MKLLKKLGFAGSVAIVLMVTASGAKAYDFGCGSESCMPTQCWEFWCFWGG